MEVDIMRKIQIEISKLGGRVFRNNTGTGWTGNKIIRITEVQEIFVSPGDIVIRNARPLHAGLIEGSSDLIGWTDKGKFLAVEVKDKGGKLTDSQAVFLSVVNSAGGVGIMAKSEVEAVQKYNERKS